MRSSAGRKLKMILFSSETTISEEIKNENALESWKHIKRPANGANVGKQKIKIAVSLDSRHYRHTRAGARARPWLYKVTIIMNNQFMASGRTHARITFPIQFWWSAYLFFIKEKETHYGRDWVHLRICAPLCGRRAYVVVRTYTKWIFTAFHFDANAFAATLGHYHFFALWFLHNTITMITNNNNWPDEWRIYAGKQAKRQRRSECERHYIWIQN